MITGNGENLAGHIGPQKQEEMIKALSFQDMTVCVQKKISG
jgi:hypothetical protein